MDRKQNYQRLMEETIEQLQGQERSAPPTLMLHSCCAPCSSYVLETLSRYFAVTVFYCNPNIYPEEEFYKRRREQERFIERFPANIPIKFIGTEHGSDMFYEAVKGLEGIPEGGGRCLACFRLRLYETAMAAKNAGADFFTTTLSISPLKNAEALNRIGGEIAEQAGVRYLYSDFKKKNGYKRSTELSREYGIYRQDYCGCVFSKRERELKKLSETSK